MSNVIEMNKNPDQELIDNLITQINIIKNQINEDKKKIIDETRLSNELIILEAGTTDRVQKRSYKDDKKALDANIKLMKTSVNAKEEQLNNVEVQLGKIRQKRKQEFVQLNSQSTAEKVFDENNIHYVIFDQQWWSVDPIGGRMDVRINNSEAGVIKDLIFNDSNWEISSEQELKKLAKDMGRMYKHIVRDFSGPRAGIYNQMQTIRNQWLKPIHGVEPHIGFRLLCLSIAGNDESYADQLEKFVAYRYCHPEDVMIPNIDSCATGGTGRDTFFNIIRTIFTDECCGSAGEETFKGTHNGDLFGKMFIKVDEKDSTRVPIDKIKELTGSNRYRHRQMNKDAREAQRLFSFFFFRNGFTSTAKLAGTGTSGEDRRFEPIIARINLPRYLALHYELISNINEQLTDEQTKAMQIIIKEWQTEYYKNEERISEWLGYIIDKHNSTQMTDLLPVHGVYYKEMLQRQQKGIDGFMPKLISLMRDSTIINIKDAQKLYEVAENQKCTKEWFKNNMMYWLNTKLGWDCEELQAVNVFTWTGCTNEDRRKMNIVQNKLNIPQRLCFNIQDFIDIENIDDKGNSVGEKINIYSVRDELK
jgi:hypothetical protein